MKTLKVILFFIVIMSSCTSTQNVINDNSTDQVLKKELIGTWDFEILKDKNGVKVDTIFHKFGPEIPKGPTITFNEDGTYSKQFTPQNIDTGKWYYDNKENAIKYLLYYKKPYDKAAQYLIKKGHAQKDKKGNYYEVLTERIYKLDQERLTIIEREERRRTFRKR